MSLTQALRDDWGLDMVALVCNHCDWNYLSVTDHPRLCPHCFIGELATFDADDNNLPELGAPELVIDYRIDHARLSNIIQYFAEEIPYPPRDLTSENMISRAKRVYLPMWLADATVKATWEAQAGYPYQVESHTSSYQSGQWVSRKVYETRTDWEKRVGQLNRVYDNIPAPALAEHHQLLEHLGDYKLEEAHPYSAENVREALVRLPNRNTEDALTDAQENFRYRAAQDIKQATEADNIRAFTWRAGYQNLHWTQLLLPVFMTYYNDDDNKRRVVFINGYTGHPSGAKRGSMLRARQRTFIGLAITALVAIAAVILVLIRPDLDDIAALLAIVAVFIGIGALVPVFQVWRFNDHQEKWG